MICLEDRKIIDLFFERSEQAVHELNCKYGAAIKKTTSNDLHDRLDVEECVNDTFLQVWNSIPPRTPNPLSGYVCRIARNLAINRYHANNAVKRGGRYDLILDEMQECIPSEANVETEYDAKELSAAINRFLAAQSREDRSLFVRRYFFGDSPEELAARTGSSRGRVGVRLFRLREKLRKSLQKEGLLV